ncbi:MAG: protein kinase [Pseudomonadota bacterium]
MSETEPTQVTGLGLTIPPGTRLNGIFEIERQIGAGGMGMVYRANNVETGDKVAIKIVRAEMADNQQVLALFRKEAAVLHRLLHDAIVRYYLFTSDPVIGRPYLATEFVDGTALHDMGGLERDDVLALAERLADGLQAAHAVSIFHRDISPDNIILPERDVRQAKIIDFGIARAAAVGGGTVIGDSIAGKFDYMSPEQLGLFGASVDARSDIYSLGIVLAEAILGRSLRMGGTQLEVVEKRRKVPDLSEVEPKLRGLLSSMLQPKPDDRIQTMAEVAQAARSLSEGRSSGKGGFIKIAAGIGAVALIGGAVAVYLMGEGTDQDTPTTPPPLVQRTDDGVTDPNAPPTLTQTRQNTDPFANVAENSSTTEEPATPPVQTGEVDEPVTPPVQTGEVDEPVTPPVQTGEVDEPATPPVQTGEVDEPATPPVQTGEVDEPATPPVQTGEVDEPATPPVQTGEVDEPATPPVQTGEVDEPATPPVQTGEVDEPATPPVQTGEVDEPATPPVQTGEVDEPVTPPAQTGEVDEPVTPPVQTGEVDEPVAPPVQTGEVDEPVAPPVQTGEVDEPVAPPVQTGEVDEPVTPPVQTGEVDEPVTPPVQTGEVDEPVEPPVQTGEVDEPVAPPVQTGEVDEPVAPPVQTGETDEPIIEDEDPVARFVRTARLGPCTHIRLVDGTADAPIIEAYGASAAPFYQFDEDFREALGFEADIRLRPITQNQCPAVELVAAVGNAIDHTLGVRVPKDNVIPGDVLAASVSGLEGRDLHLYLVTSDGSLYGLDDFLRRRSNDADFQTIISGPSGPAAGQLLLALAGEALPQIPSRSNGHTAADLAELGRTLAHDDAADAALGYFKYEADQ